ncbi:MAG: hypothetical protein LUC93_04705 [Planctomycetaceae bacterium]|nr:hypothetical protein [Planctomycetaceae bacterium]
MQVPKPTHGSVRQPNMPNVRVGVQANADAFGGGRARQIQDLAQAGQRAGNVLISEAQVRQERDDETFTMGAIVEARKQLDNERQSLYEKYKGKDAVNLHTELESRLQSVRQKTESGLQNAKQRERFNRAFMAISSQENQRAFSYRDQQVEAARIKTFQDVITGVGAESQAKITAATGYEEALAGPQLKIILDTTDKLTEGQSDESRQLARTNATKAWHQDNVKAAGNISPELALKYLGDDRVKGAFSEGDWMGLRKGYEVAAEYSEIAQMAMDAHDSEDPEKRMDSDQAMRFAWEKWRDNKTKRDQFLANYDNYGQRKKIAKDAETVETRSGLTASWIAAGYDISNLSGEDAGRLAQDVQFMGALATLGPRMQRALNGGMLEKAVPNYSELSRVSDMSDDKRKSHLQDPANYVKLVESAGGDKDKIKLVEQGKFNQWWTGGSSGSGSGSGTGSARTDIDLLFKNNFAVLRGNPGEGWYGQDAYDSTNNQPPQIYDNFMHYYGQRIKDVAAYPGQSPESRAQDIAYELMRDINNGDVDINRPTYETFVEDHADDGSVTIEVGSLTENEATLWHKAPLGTLKETIDPETKKTVKWHEFSLEEAGKFVPLVVQQTGDGMVRRYITEFDFQGKSMPPDTIVYTEKNGNLRAIDRLTQNLIDVDLGSPMNLAQAAYDQKSAELKTAATTARGRQVDAPEWVEPRIAMLEGQYGHDISWEWTGRMLSVRVPKLGAVKNFDRRGYPLPDEIDYGNGNWSQENTPAHKAEQ